MLENRRLLSGNPFEPPAVVNPGDIEVFNGVRIDASLFPASPVTVEVTNLGPRIALPQLRNGVVTGVMPINGQNPVMEIRNGVDGTSTLPGIVFMDGLEDGTAGVQIYGSVADAVSGFDPIKASLDSALVSLRNTREILAQIGADTAAFDARIAELNVQFGAVKASLDRVLTSTFTRVTVPGVYDAYFLRAEVTSPIVVGRPAKLENDPRAERPRVRPVAARQAPTPAQLQVAPGATELVTDTAAKGAIGKFATGSLIKQIAQ